MGKPGGSGGGPSGNIFSDSIFGPPPGDLTVGSTLWIDLGLIPTGKNMWFGSGQYISTDKTIKFELRTSNLGESAGSDAKTTVLTSVSCRAGTTKLVDYYRKGRLHIVSVVSTGVEHWWLKLSAKGSAGSFLYQINYTTE